MCTGRNFHACHIPTYFSTSERMIWPDRTQRYAASLRTNEREIIPSAGDQGEATNVITNFMARWSVSVAANQDGRVPVLQIVFPCFDAETAIVERAWPRDALRSTQTSG